MLRATLEIDGVKKAEFNILENDYDSASEDNYTSFGDNPSEVGLLSEPLDEIDAESVIMFSGKKKNFDGEPTAQISNVVFSDVIYDNYELMTTAIEDGMYSSAEFGGKVIVDGDPTGNYNARAFSSGIRWDSNASEIKHLVSSSIMSNAAQSTNAKVIAFEEVWAYRLINRVESKVAGKSIAVVVDGYKI